MWHGAAGRPASVGPFFAAPDASSRVDLHSRAKVAKGVHRQEVRSCEWYDASRFRESSDGFDTWLVGPGRSLAGAWRGTMTIRPVVRGRLPTRSTGARRYSARGPSTMPVRRDCSEVKRRISLEKTSRSARASARIST